MSHSCIAKDLPSTMVYRHGGQAIDLEAISSEQAEGIQGMAVEILEDASDYFDGVFLSDQVETMKEQGPSLEILFASTRQFHLAKLDRDIKADRLLFIYNAKGYIRYVFWGEGSYRLDGEVLGCRDPEKKLLEILNTLSR